MEIANALPVSPPFKSRRWWQFSQWSLLCLIILVAVGALIVKDDVRTLSSLQLVPQTNNEIVLALV